MSARAWVFPWPLARAMASLPVLRPVTMRSKVNSTTVRIAAAILAPKDVSKMFSSEIARDYIVVEVAVYPGAPPFDVESSDFALSVGQRIGRTDRPIDVVPWPESFGGLESRWMRGTSHVLA